MVGQGVLRECLLDADVESVLAVGRSPTGRPHAKLREIVHDNFLDYSGVESQLPGFDACFFCLGVSSVGMGEERYRQLTYDITLAAARTLAKLNPGMVFVYVTGRGTDSSEQGRLMWARVKGKTENDLLKLPFKAAYMFRPAGIQPLHGIRSKTAWYQAAYVVAAPVLTLLNRVDAEIRDHHRAGRTRHDQGGAGRLSQAGAGKRRYQRRLVVIPGGPKDQTRNLEIPRCAIAHLRFTLVHRLGMTVQISSSASHRPGMTVNPIK